MFYLCYCIILYEPKLNKSNTVSKLFPTYKKAAPCGPVQRLVGQISFYINLFRAWYFLAINFGIQYSSLAWYTKRVVFVAVLRLISLIACLCIIVYFSSISIRHVAQRTILLEIGNVTSDSGFPIPIHVK